MRIVNTKKGRFRSMNRPFRCCVRIYFLGAAGLIGAAVFFGFK
jgi:hypothetical protein